MLDARERRGRGLLTATALKQFIKAAGFCVTKHGLLADPDLREVMNFLEIFKYDFMHTSFQDGYMSNAMYLICESVLRIKYGNANDGAPLVDFMKSLQFSFARATDKCRLRSVFSEKLMPKHRRRKCIVANASTQFSLYRLLEFWANEAAVDYPALLEHCAVYSAACRVTDVFRDCKYRRLDTASASNKLPPLISTWQDLHKVKYGDRYWRPKFCWIWPIALDIALSPFEFDMWHIERQHRRVKPHAENVRNTTNWEGSVLMRVVDAQICALQFSVILDGLPADKRKVRAQCAGIPAFMGDHLRSNGAYFHVDDIVARGVHLGCILACYARDDAVLMLLVECFRATASATQFEHTPHRELWPAIEVRAALAWRPTAIPRVFEVIL